jgi:hypothetical protein
MTGPLFASRLEVVSNIRAVARRIYQSSRDEWLQAHDVQERNFIDTIRDILRRILHSPADKQNGPRKKGQFGMIHIQMLAAAGMDTKRSERCPFQQFFNRFWVHAPILLRA